jgi:hypothetical protein
VAVRVARGRNIRPDHPFAASVHTSNRYLLDQYGVPFLMRGCSPWLMMTYATTASELRTFFSLRFFQGFNTAIAMFCPPLGYAGNNSATEDGLRPFNGQTSNWATIDVTDPNETYWARVDTMLAVAAANGFTVVASPMDWFGWVGAGPSGTDPITAQGTGGWSTYGQFLGARYAETPNLVWMLGDDYGSDDWAACDQYVSAMANGIRTGGANHPMMSLLYQQPSYDNTTVLALCDLATTYDYHPVYHQHIAAYADTPTLPVLLTETQYEGEDNEGLVGAPAGADVIRRQLLWALTSGAPGGFYGHATEWQFLTGWETLATTAITHTKAIYNYWATLPWWTLAPDDGSGLVTAGRGTRYNGTGSVGPLTNSYATCCRNTANTLAVIHVPTARTISINEATMAGTVTAQWVDPTNGATQTATGSSGDYTTPGNNAAGDGDWLLVVRGTG